MEKKTFLVVLIAIIGAWIPFGRALALDPPDGSFRKIPGLKEGVKQLKAGDPAPDFALKDIENNEFRLRGCCGKDVVVLFFWDLIGHAASESDAVVNDVAKEYLGKGVQVVGISLFGHDNPGRSGVLGTQAKKMGWVFRILFDEMEGDRYKVSETYGDHRIVVIDGSGIVSGILDSIANRSFISSNHREVGERSRAELRKAIEKALR